jgi:hypothetical protein
MQIGVALQIDFPNPSLIRNLLSRYVSVRLNVAVEHLAEGDLLALRKLIEAASGIDRIYWKQRSEEGWLLTNSGVHSRTEDARELERLLKINFGPWDNFDDDRPFWGKQQRPPGGNFYPPDLTREEFGQYLAQHPEQRRSLLSHTTLVRRQGDRLIAILYQEAYKEELLHIAKGLEQAGELVTHPRFRAFLQARARDLVTGSLRESETLWIDVSDSPIDIAIGPYEVYDDALLGVKTSYEATVMVRHPMTERLRQFEAVAPELERRLPGAVASAETRRRFMIGVYDVAFTAGMTNMGGKAIAATLPNDESVRTEVGARLLLFRNVISAKFDPILKPLGARVLRKDQLDLVREDAFLYHTLLHEMAHALSTCFVRRGDKQSNESINEALRERYAMIEECRADLLGMVFLNLLASRGFLPREINAAASVTFIVNSVRALRFGAGDDYSRGAAIILSHLFRKGALKTEYDGELSVDVQGVQRGVEELAATVQDIATRGDYEAAGHLIGGLGSIPHEIDRLRPRFADVPIDLEFVFDDLSGPL